MRKYVSIFQLNVKIDGLNRITFKARMWYIEKNSYTWYTSRDIRVISCYYFSVKDQTIKVTIDLVYISFSISPQKYTRT